MPAHLVVYPDRHELRIRITRSLDHGGPREDIHATIGTDDLSFTLLGPATQTAELLQAFARAATDAAVLMAAEQDGQALATTYQPTGPIVDGVEVTTNRLACCGVAKTAVDRGDPHLPGCTLTGPAAEHLRRQAENQAVA